MAKEVGERVPGFTLPADDRENTAIRVRQIEPTPKTQPELGKVLEDLEKAL